MPVISAFADHPTRPYVRVEVNWADQPQVEYARVLRVDALTGECVPLRPYICYQGDYLLLSCGLGIFWDTEIPFDREYYYITEGLDAACLPTGGVYDEFGRVVAAGGWGTTTSGLPWVISNAPAANFSVNGSAGRIAPSAVAVRQIATIDSVSIADGSVSALVRPNMTATGAAFEIAPTARKTSDGDYYYAHPRFEPAGTVSARISRFVGGVATNLVNVPGVLTYNSNSRIGVLFEFVGSDLRLKIWDAALGPAPVAWTTTATDTSHTVGTVGMVMNLSTGNTNVGPVSFVDDFEATDYCSPCAPVTAQTSPNTEIASDGRFWLKDPVRPCHDQPVPLCQDSAPLRPECGGDGGILFVGVSPDIYANNSYTLRPTNRRRTMSVTRPRGDAASSLRLQTLTFADRDALLELAAPGSPLLFQGPAEYGVPDRYMAVRDVQVSPELPDLRIQVRSETLPYLTEARPAGPTQGICGARVADICDGYASWDALAATGMTWEDLVRGAASPASANPAARTWDDVNADFADWNAANTGGRTWDGLQAGD